MSFRFEEVSLDVRTGTRRTRYLAALSAGLNIISAPNSWGKSTLIQSLVYGLGREGAFSASHLSPLGEAMSSVIDLDGQREAVVESAVTVTLLNDDGIYLRCRRYPAQSRIQERSRAYLDREHQGVARCRDEAGSLRPRRWRGDSRIGLPQAPGRFHWLCAADGPQFQR